MDGRTSTLNAYSYARALVMVDASEELLEEVTISVRGKDSFVQKILYDYYPKFCSNCKCIGHTNAKCPRRNLPKNPVEKSVDHLLAKDKPILVNERLEMHADSVFTAVDAVVNSTGCVAPNSCSPGKSKVIAKPVENKVIANCDFVSCTVAENPLFGDPILPTNPLILKSKTTAPLS